MTLRILKKDIQHKQKKQRWPERDPLFIKIKKIEFNNNLLSNDCIRTFILNKFTSMQDSKNSN